MIVEFGDWRPDNPDFGNGGATEAKNVIPAEQSYRQFGSLDDASDALDNRCQGAVAGRDNDGNTYNFAGDDTKLYRLQNASFSDVSNGTYTIDAAETWQFAQYGEDLIATNIADNVQKFTMGTDSNFSDLMSTFKARYVDTVREFLVFGNTSDATDGTVPHRVRWSAQGDHTDYNISSVTQSDYQDLNAANGWMQQVVGGAYGILFQERAITRMTYVGSPLVFQFDLVERNRGTQASNSVIPFGNFIAYLGENGFYIFDGSRSTAIGAGRIDKTFYNDLDDAYLERVHGVNDPINKLLIWAYPGDGNNGTANKLIFYNYSQNATRRWSQAEVNTEVLVRSLSEGYTMDTLDSYNSSLDAIEISLDSRFWTGGQINLSGITTEHKLATFTGSALSAVLETPEFEINNGRRTMLSRIRPLISGGSTITVQVGYRDALEDSVTWGVATSLEGSGSAAIRNNSRFHRFRVNVSGGFTHAQGVDVYEHRAAGRR